MADESITQNEDGYELLAVLVFILGTPLGLLLYEKGGETEHVRVEFLVFPPLYAERWLVIVTELYGQIAVHNGKDSNSLTYSLIVLAKSPVGG